MRSQLLARVSGPGWCSPASGRICTRPGVRGGVVFFPHESALEVNGLSAEPLPTATLRAAARVLDLLAHAELGTRANLDGDLP